MSNKKKPKKLRTPNVPSPQSITVAAASFQARGGGQESSSSTRLARPAVAAAQANFDYTYVKKDLGRIAVLAGSFIVILVALSFFIK